MKNKVLIIVIVIVAGLSYMFLANGNNDGSCVVGSKDVKESANTEVGIIDVRTPQEYKSGHVEGAKNIDIYSSEFKKLVGGLDKDKTYYVYCKTGVRSSKAQKVMNDLGFKKVCNVNGGVLKLQSEGVKLVN